MRLKISIAWGNPFSVNALRFTVSSYKDYNIKMLIGIDIYVILFEYKSKTCSLHEYIFLDMELYKN